MLIQLKLKYLDSSKVHAKRCTTNTDRNNSREASMTREGESGNLFCPFTILKQCNTICYLACKTIYLVTIFSLPFRYCDDLETRSKKLTPPPTPKDFQYVSNFYSTPLLDPREEVKANKTRRSRAQIDNSTENILAHKWHNFCENKINLHFPFTNIRNIFSHSTGVGLTRGQIQFFKGIVPRCETSIQYNSAKQKITCMGWKKNPINYIKRQNK